MTIKDMKDPHKQCVKSNPVHWNFGTMPTSTTRQAWLDKATEVFAKGVRNFEWGTALVRFAEVHKHWTDFKEDETPWSCKGLYLIEKYAREGLKKVCAQHHMLQSGINSELMHMRRADAPTGYVDDEKDFSAWQYIWFILQMCQTTKEPERLAIIKEWKSLENKGKGWKQLWQYMQDLRNVKWKLDT